jgi:hypothetical protein
MRKATLPLKRDCVAGGATSGAGALVLELDSAAKATVDTASIAIYYCERGVHLL